MLIKQVYQKNVIFVTIGILKISVLNISLIFVKAEVIKTNFLGNDMPKKNMHDTCIACKNYPQIYLKKCKYKTKKYKCPNS